MGETPFLIPSTDQAPGVLIYKMEFSQLHNCFDLVQPGFQMCEQVDRANLFLGSDRFNKERSSLQTSRNRKSNPK